MCWATGCSFFFFGMWTSINFLCYSLSLHYLHISYFEYIIPLTWIERNCYNILKNLFNGHFLDSLIQRNFWIKSSIYPSLVLIIFLNIIMNYFASSSWFCLFLFLYSWVWVALLYISTILSGSCNSIMTSSFTHIKRMNSLLVYLDFVEIFSRIVKFEGIVMKSKKQWYKKGTLMLVVVVTKLKCIKVILRTQSPT